MKEPRKNHSKEFMQKEVDLRIGSVNDPELDDRLTGKERIFKSPPLTTDLVKSIKLISPHCNFTTDEKYRLIWEADQNGACWGEYEALQHLFQSIQKPKQILEIGPGMGRSLVFFSKKLGWENCEIHAYEGDGNSTKYTILGPRFDDSFCGNINALRHVLSFNGINNITIFKASEKNLADLPVKYDFLYSFYSIGFHWSIEHFWSELLTLMHDTSIAVFTVPNMFKPFSELESIYYRIINFKTAWPKDGSLKLLIISKSMLPAS